MCFKGDSVVNFKLIYLLHFKLFTYFKVILFGTFFVIVVFPPSILPPFFLAIISEYKCSSNSYFIHSYCI